MPRGENIIARRHQQAFERAGIRPEYAEYARVSYEGDGGGTCSLCGNPNLRYLYKLSFDIPAIEYENGLVRPNQQISFDPVGSECIVNWARFLAETNPEAHGQYEAGAVRQLRTFENERIHARTVTQRRERINDFFNNNGLLNYVTERFDENVRSYWAENFGDVSLNRAFELVRRIDNHWSYTIRMEGIENLISYVTVNINPETMREVQPRRIRTCGLCGPGMHTTQRRPRTSQTVMQDYTCPMCRTTIPGRAYRRRGATSLPIAESASGTEFDPRRTQETSDRIAMSEEDQPVPTPEASVRLTVQAAGDTNITTWEEFANHPRATRLPEGLRLEIIIALRNWPRLEIVRSIAGYALRQGRISDRQNRVIRDRTQGTAPAEADITEPAVEVPDEPGIQPPICPVHGEPMRLVDGQYGGFFSCQRYPNCRVTANLRGRFSNVPPPPPPPQSAPPQRTLSQVRPPRPARQGSRGEVPPALMNTDEYKAMIEQGKLFRRIISATIREKLGHRAD